MKKICFLIIILVPLIVKSQALLGFTIKEIKANFPNNDFEMVKTDDGAVIYKTEFNHGSFFYLFDKKTLTTDMCVLYPNNTTNLNALVELYNKEYVIISESSWKAYLENGVIMKVDLFYDKEDKIYYFTYKP